MAENLSLNVTVDTTGATSSVGSLKKQLREAQAEVTALADKFGATSKEAVNAAKKAAELKDRIADSKALTDAYNPDQKFKALTASLSGVAGGFGAVQGAMALFGVESDNVQKTLLKVQSAMAISQGLNAVGDSIDSFRTLGNQIQNSTLFQKANTAATQAAAVVQKLFTGSVDTTSTGFKNLKGAMAATGIGLLIVAITYLIANFDELSDAISGTTEVEKEHRKAQEEVSKATSDFTVKLYSVQSALAAAKKGTISKKDALKEYNDKLGATVGYANSLEQAENLMAANTATVIKSIRLKTEAQALYAIAAQKSASLVELAGNAGIKPGNKDVDFALAETKKYLEQSSKDLKDKADNLMEQALELESTKVKGADKPSETGKKGETLAEKNARIKKEKDAAELEASKRLITLRNELEVKGIDDQYESKKLAIQQNLTKEIKDINANEFLKKETKEALITALENVSKKETDDITKEQEKDKLKKEEEFQKELNKIKLETKLLGIQDEYEKSKTQLEDNYNKQYEDIEKNETYGLEKKIALKAALQQKENAELDALKLVADKKKAEEDIATLDKEIAKNVANFDLERELLGKKDLLLKESFDKKLILEDEYKAGVEANSKARTEIDKKEADAKIALAQGVAQALSQASDLVGKQTSAGKTLAVASALISTYQGIAAGVKLGYPLAIPAVAMAAMTGFSAVKNILAVKVPSASGGGSPNMPNVSTSAPMTPAAPQAQTTNISQASINQMGNQAVRAYVIETDVTSNQQRVEAIKQRARFS